MSRALWTIGKRLRREESGVVAVIVALFLLVLLVLGALVLDLGSLYDHDRELQSAADAAALAGAQELIYTKGDFGATEDEARKYVTANSAPGSSVQELNIAPWNPAIVYTNAEKSVAVDLRENHVPFSFARVIGRTEGSVTAHAKAQIMYLTSMNGLFPVAIPYLHPDHFTITYGSGANAISYPLRDALDNTDGDLGLYEGSRSNASLALGPGLHSVSLGAQNAAGEDLIEPWTDVGSLFVPDSTVNIAAADRSRIRRVDVTRTITVPPDGTSQLSESIIVRLRTSAVIENKVQVQIEVDGKSGGSGGGKYWLSTSDTGTDRVYASDPIGITASSWNTTTGEALVTITTYEKNNKSTFPDGVRLASYAMFQRGEAIVFVDQGPDPWDNYSAAGSYADLSARVQTKIYKFGVSTVIKSSQKGLASFVGEDGWADMWTGAQLEQEIELALGDIAPQAGWQLTPDTAGQGGNEDGNADVGEWVPFKPGIRVGQWKGALESAQGKTVSIALVTPDPEASKHDSMVIQSFAAFEIAPAPNGVVINGNEVSISGTFVHWLNTGEWTPNNPGGLYIETAVLTE